MIAAPGKVQVANFALPVANTLYFFDVPQDTTHITLKARNNTQVQMSFNDMTEFLTLHPRIGYSEQNIKFNGAITFIGSVDNEIMEIITWYGTP